MASARRAPRRARNGGGTGLRSQVLGHQVVLPVAMECFVSVVHAILARSTIHT